MFLFGVMARLRFCLWQCLILASIKETLVEMWEQRHLEAKKTKLYSKSSNSHMFLKDGSLFIRRVVIHGSHDLQGCLAELIYLLIDCG